jgi:hypothetical protein
MSKMRGTGRRSMGQSWAEHEPNQEEFLRYLEGEGGLTPCAEMIRWRRRFWALVLVVVMGLVLLWVLR